MISTHINENQVASLCTSIAPIFTQLNQNDTKALLESAPWRELSSLTSSPIEEPTLKNFQILRTMLFLPGVAFAALPVESLYKSWKSPEGVCASRGLYGGDSARHIRYLCQELGLEIPREFSATPDHIAILLELVGIFAQASNEKMLVCFIKDHFDWLENYKETLKSRISQAHESSIFDERDGFATFESALMFLLQNLNALSVLLECEEVKESSFL